MTSLTRRCTVWILQVVRLSSPKTWHISTAISWISRSVITSYSYVHNCHFWFRWPTNWYTMPFLYCWRCLVALKTSSLFYPSCCTTCRYMFLYNHCCMKCGDIQHLKWFFVCRWQRQPEIPSEHLIKEGLPFLDDLGTPGISCNRFPCGLNSIHQFPKCWLLWQADSSASTSKPTTAKG